MPRLTTEEAAAYLKCSISTLAQFRMKGGGPRYAKPAGRVYYDTADLDRWIEDSSRTSTSDTPMPRRRRGRPRKVSTA